MLEKVVKKILGIFLEVGPQFSPKKFSFRKGSLFFGRIISRMTSINFFGDFKDKKRRVFCFSGEKQLLFWTSFFFFFPNVLTTEKKEEKLRVT